MVSSDESGTIYLDPLKENGHQYTLIFLHGLGDTSQGFLDVFCLEYVAAPTCRIVLPTAPRKPVSLNDGYVMNSWFDM